MDNLDALTDEGLRNLNDDDLARVAGQFLEQKAEVRKENQILYYEAASKAAEQIHFSRAGTIGVGGGNRSAKTETCLVEEIALATGVFPVKYAQEFREKFRGPLNVRICIESLTTVLHPIILPKLKYWVWTGIDQQGGLRGHWGWVPRMCLKGGEWDKSWSEKLRLLTFLCRDPDDTSKVLGESQIQFMSYDQDASDFASGTFHIVHMDEPPPAAVWRENQARVLDVNGRIFLSMTWPDDPSIGVDWIYDEVYERGQPGPMKDPEVDWFELATLDNQFLDAEKVLQKTASWTEESKKVKLYGQPLRFSNRIHPIFTDVEQTWCMTCGKTCLPVDDVCGCERKSVDIAEFIHVQDFEIGDNWPCVFLLDPHPRKPHMFLWAAIDPSDDIWIVAEAEVEGDAADVKRRAEEMEEVLGLDVRLKLMDPNMGRSPSGARREVTWQDEFESAGLRIDLADDSSVGRKRINQYLKPDPSTRRPRLMIHTRCQSTAMQMKRYVWDDYRKSADRDLKQQPKAKYDDFPTLIKYLMNYDPNFRLLYAGAPILKRAGKGRY